MAEPSAAPRRVGLRRMLSLARPELGRLTIATVALLVGASMGLIYPQAVSYLVDAINGRPRALPGLGSSPPFDQVVLVLLGLFTLQALAGMLRSWLFTVAGERVVARLRSDLYAAILVQEIAFFDRERTGELTNRLASDTAVLQNTVTVNLSMALRFGTSALGAAALLAWTSPRLAALVLAVVPAIVLGASVYGRLVRRWSRDVQDALAAATSVAEETFGGVRTVRAFAREAAEIARYNVAVDTSYRLAAKRALAVGVFNGFLGFAGNGAIALVVWYGGRLVLDGAMTTGELTAFLLYTLTVAFSLGALSDLWGDLMKASGASERVFELLDRVPDGRTGARVLSAIEGRIHFQDVSFAYPGRPDAPVLVDVDLEVEPGQVVALVGPSGSGKSTMAALLSRFYDPQAGAIQVDGHDLRDLEASALRAHIGVVSQEPTLFATTIAENIRYGRPDADDQAVLAAARAANAEGFVRDFPEGFATPVGERGVRLSGGQKQRIAIARAVLKDPAILILDEATSALDAESEHLVQEALERLMRGRTTLVIAHRLSTVRDADQVVVLDAGRVVERGVHAELLDRPDGLYRKLVERQVAG